jgi:ankyrin repeat protein
LIKQNISLFDTGYNSKNENNKLWEIIAFNLPTSEIFNENAMINYLNANGSTEDIERYKNILLFKEISQKSSSAVICKTFKQNKNFINDVDLNGRTPVMISALLSPSGLKDVFLKKLVNKSTIEKRDFLGRSFWFFVYLNYHGLKDKTTYLNIFDKNYLKMRAQLILMVGVYIGNI